LRLYASKSPALRSPETLLASGLDPPAREDVASAIVALDALGLLRSAKGWASNILFLVHFFPKA
jgi:hypothetical protein